MTQHVRSMCSGALSRGAAWYAAGAGRVIAAGLRGTRATAAAIGAATCALAGIAHRHRVGHRIGLAVALVVVTLAGLSAGLLLGGRTHDDVGPFAARFAITPSLSGGTEVQIPPLGSLQLASHDGPAHLTVRLDTLDQQRTLALASDPKGIQKASQGAATDVERGVVRVAFQAAGAGLLGAMLLAGLVFRSMRRVAMCGSLALVTIVGSGIVALSTFRASSVEEPRYQGLLANAPAVIGDAKRIATQYGQYRDELQQLINNVSRLYGTFSALPVYAPAPGSLRVLHISDLHLNPAAWSVITTVVKQYDINMIIDTGDINDWGTTMESSFVDSIGSLGVPYVFVRGNHDSATTQDAVARQRNAVVLDNRVVTIQGLTIAGIGDPQFTPDKSSVQNQGASAHQAADQLDSAGARLAGTIGQAHGPVDVALVHDPAMAGPLDGTTQLVLAGHLHARHVNVMPAIPGKPRTTLMVEGSTGGAGLRGLEGEAPTPLDMSVLYFNPGHTLEAYDDITLGGTGQTEVTIQRHVIKKAGTPSASVSPSPSG